MKRFNHATNCGDCMLALLIIEMMYMFTHTCYVVVVRWTFGQKKLYTDLVAGLSYLISYSYIWLIIFSDFYVDWDDIFKLTCMSTWKLRYKFFSLDNLKGW